MHHNALGLDGWSLTWVKGWVKLFYGRQHQSRKVTESIVMKRKAHAIRRWPLTSCRRSSDPSTAGSCRTSAVEPAPFAWRLLWSSSCHDRWEPWTISAAGVSPDDWTAAGNASTAETQIHLSWKCLKASLSCFWECDKLCEALTWIQHKTHTQVKYLMLCHGQNVKQSRTIAVKV